MKSHSLRRAFTAASIASTCALTAFAAEDAFYVVGKAQIFTQTTAAGSVADPNGAFGFTAQAPATVTFTVPAGTVVPIPRSSDGQGFELDALFSTKSALDAAYPNGTYRMAGAGISPLSFDLTTDLYPTANPAVTNGTWTNGVLVLNPAPANTITISNNASYATSGVAGHMSISLRGIFDPVDLNNEIATQPIFGNPPITTPVTSLAIPAGQLTSGRLYEGEVVFDTVAGLDRTSVPGGAAATLFSKNLKFYVFAQAPGTTTPAAVIVNQPANQTVALGGTATFSLNVTVGGSPQFTNLQQVWYFNGRRLNFDGTKYSFSPTSFGMQVKNVTAADVGSYSVQLVNAGGIVTSNAATLSIGTPGAPVFTLQPSAQPITIPTNGTVVLTASATAVPGPTYQWQRDGVNIQGAVGPTLVLIGNTGPNATLSGSYRVIASNGVGPGTTSTATPVNVVATADPGRLINLSILTSLAANEKMTMGTVLGGGGTIGTKPLLARAVGPTLGTAPFNIAGILPDPKMSLISTSVSPAVTVASNNRWGGSAALAATFSSLGAFAYASPNSNDSAVFQPALAPGNYTVEVSDAGTGSGTVIAELYDATPSGTYTPAVPRLVNVSVLKQINTNGTLTAGFVIGGTTSRTVLIRAVGPTLGLTPFNIAGAMADPQLKLFDASGAVIATNNDWGGDGQISGQSNRVGAFALSSPQSKDAVLMITLPGGGANYTAQVSAVGAGGTAIVEVYEVP